MDQNFWAVAVPCCIVPLVLAGTHWLAYYIGKSNYRIAVTRGEMEIDHLRERDQ